MVMPSLTSMAGSLGGYPPGSYMAQFAASMNNIGQQAALIAGVGPGGGLFGGGGLGGSTMRLPGYENDPSMNTFVASLNTYTGKATTLANAARQSVALASLGGGALGGGSAAGLSQMLSQLMTMFASLKQR